MTQGDFHVEFLDPVTVTVGLANYLIEPGSYLAHRVEGDDPHVKVVLFHLESTLGKTAVIRAEELQSFINDGTARLS